LLQRPYPRPFADGIGERGALGGKEGHQHVVHVAAVVDDENHRRVGLHPRQRFLVDVADAHAVDQAGYAARQRVADAEIDPGVERGHDLARQAVDAVPGGGKRLVGRLGMLGRRGLHLGVMEQAVDEHFAAGQREGRQADCQPRVDLADHLVHPAAEEPAHARREQQHQ